jgi:hypothetical protein
MDRIVIQIAAPMKTSARRWSIALRVYARAESRTLAR